MRHDQSEADAEVLLQRLMSFNPFVAGLKDRAGARKHHFLLFDGETGLNSFPIAEFDGYPIEKEVYFIILAVLIVLASALLPLLPLLASHWLWWVDAILAASFLIFVTVVCIAASFRLVGIRSAYRAANSDILAANFVQKARGIKSIIHTFKVIVFWRRYLHYMMVVGYFLLAAVAVVWCIIPKTKILAGANWNLQHWLGVALMAVSVLSLWVFQIIRVRFTQGMDPTLALVLMVEELGGQLLASRQTKIVDSTTG